jgi:hypothetical protein
LAPLPVPDGKVAPPSGGQLAGATPLANLSELTDDEIRYRTARITDRIRTFKSGHVKGSEKIWNRHGYGSGSGIPDLHSEEYKIFEREFGEYASDATAIFDRAIKPEAVALRKVMERRTGNLIGRGNPLQTGALNEPTIINPYMLEGAAAYLEDLARQLPIGSPASQPQPQGRDRVEYRNLRDLSPDELRKRVLETTRAIRVMAAGFERESEKLMSDLRLRMVGADGTEKAAIWEGVHAKGQELSLKQHAAFKVRYLEEIRALGEEMAERLGMQWPLERGFHTVVFEGRFSGPRPIEQAATVLEDLARQL